MEAIAEDDVWVLDGKLYGRTNLVPPYSCARIAGAASIPSKGTTFVKEARWKNRTHEPLFHPEGREKRSGEEGEDVLHLTPRIFNLLITTPP